jgi:DNA sulfur modification protein DndD
MKDIGPFRGTKVIAFEDDGKKNGYAFFGANGRGKTSIYNAMKWCLWGEVKTRVRASRGSKISGRRRPIVGNSDENILMNREAYENDKIQSMSVIILAENDNGEIQITREVVSKTTLPRSDDELREELTVVFGDESTSDKSRAQELIEKFFPRELQQFFFIDGEALEEYTEMMEKDSTLGLKEEIESVLRMPSMTRGIKNLENIRKKTKASIAIAKNNSKNFSQHENDLILKNKELASLNQKITSLEERIDGIKSKITTIHEQMEENKEMLILFRQMKEYETQLSSAEVQLKRSSEQRVDSFKDKAWKVMIWKRVRAINDECESQVDAANSVDFQIKNLNIQIKKSEKEIGEMNDICSYCDQKIPDLEKYIQKKKDDIENNKIRLKKIQEESVLSIDELKMKIGKIIAMKPGRTDEERIGKSEEYWKSDIRKVKNLKEKIEKLQGKITSESKDLMGELGKDLGIKEANLRKLQIDKENLSSKCPPIINEIKKLELKLGNNKPDSSSEFNMDMIIGKLIVTMKDTMENYREQARSLVEENASEVFMQVTNAPATFAGIKLDKEFRAQILLKSGRIATAPSSGMKSMMTISIIDALRRVSTLNAPIFFDTPGRSLDEPHKIAQLNYFWRLDHDSQFLIFAHSGEYKIDTTINEFGDRIVSAWELTFPGDHKKCLKCNSENIMHSKKQNRANCLECEYNWDTSEENTIITEIKI